MKTNACNIHPNGDSLFNNSTQHNKEKNINTALIE